MKKIVPKNAYLVPKEAKLMFKGMIYDTYQWQQKLFDGSYHTFEMLKRPDIGTAIAVKDDKIVIVKQLQPQWEKPRYTMPGGRAEPDETGLDAAKREAHEETGMSFKSWKLLDVVQNHEKIECFHYVYLATGFERQDEIHQDAGEQIEIELMDYEEVMRLSAGEPRLEKFIFEKYKTMDELLKAPVFEGKEVEV
ncbi:MAG TPA: NUDIX domain-containing protein [Candidatus Saccharimonadales bacterium]|nr:NUDIX domain-containing protein [Candidatus Saccharimonadales bacterium]